MARNVLIGLFVLVFAGDIAASIMHDHTLDLIFKPFIMPVLMALLFIEAPRPLTGYLRTFAIAMVFSWFGDLFLLFPVPGDKSTEIFFLAGLGSFLVSHALYIVSYTRSVKATGMPGFLLSRWYLLLPVLAYGVGLYAFMFPYLPDIVLKIAVFAYSLTIMGMAISAWDRNFTVSPNSFWLVFGGALLFVISDSCIGISVFVSPFEASSVAIMSTYMTSQALMLMGMLRQAKEG